MQELGVHGGPFILEMLQSDILRLIEAGCSRLFVPISSEENILMMREDMLASEDALPRANREVLQQLEVVAVGRLTLGSTLEKALISKDG